VEARENYDIKGNMFDSFVECQRVVTRSDLGKVWCAAASMTDAVLLNEGNMKVPIVRAAGCMALVLALSSWASAGPIYGFYNITGNNPADAATAGQFDVEVNDAGSHRVDFTFRNAGPAASSITDVYFDDGTLLGIAQIFAGPGVSFSQGASPPNLPGGNTLSPAFLTSAGFLSDSDPPAQPNGVNPGEWLTIRFNLLNPPSGPPDYTDTLAALASGELRIGIHVQGYAGGGSESFVNTAVVPLPAAAWMGMSLLGGVGGVGFFRRRRLVEA
jgi:hypothetical protein